MADNELRPAEMQDDELDVDELEDVAGGGVISDSDAVVNNCDCTNNCA
jgi:hypothetical protein